MWFHDIMRTFFFNVDKITYGLIPRVYDLLISIARTSVLSQADIIDMAERIYGLLTVFMVFKVTFSLIMYAVNPDDFSDKTKGIGKLTTNIIISLALLVLTPYIFNYAFQLQTIILEDNSLSVLVFGEDFDNANNPINTAGESMAFIVMSPFFAPNSSIDQLYECSEVTMKSGDKVIFNPACSGFKEGTLNSADDSHSLYAMTRTSGNKENPNFNLTTLKNYVTGVEMGNFSMMFREKMAKAKDENGDVYIIDYQYIFSTVLGVIVLLLLITFCLDVALRSVKLAFLQLIAPIPIISYVDPKSGKDGLFKKWYQMCFSTYLSLFIRLLAIYFAVYIIDRIDQMVDVIDGSYTSSLLVKICVILGVLMFAKQLPKILEGLGIKLDGDGKFTLNPLKKLDEGAFGFKKARQYAGRLGMAGAAGAAAFGTNMLATKGNILKRFGSGLAGAGSATARGLGNVIKGKKANEVFTNSYGAANRARQNRDARQELGVSAVSVMGNRIRQAMGIPTTAEEQDKKIKRYDEVITAAKAAKTKAESEVDKKADKIEVSGGGTLGMLRDRVETLKSAAPKRGDFAEGAAGDAAYQSAFDNHLKALNQANIAYADAKKASVNAYIQHAAAGTLSTTTAFGAAGTVFKEEDTTVSQNVKKARSAATKYSLKDENGQTITIDVAKLGDSIGSFESAKTTIEASDEYRTAHLIDEQTRKEKK